MSLVLFAIEYQIAGLRPLLGHLVNILLYIVLGWLIFKCMPLWFSNQFTKKGLVVFSFIVTLIYLAHPLHTEAVANIKGRDEIMAILFSLWAFYIQQGEKQNPWIKSIICSLVFFLALLSKENSITFVVIIPLIYWLLHNKPLKQVLSLTTPYLAAAMVFLIIRSMILGMDLTSVSSELMNNPFLKWNGQQYIPFEPLEKLSLIANTLFQYIKLFLFPHPLTHDYYPKHIDATSFSNIGSILGLLIAILLPLGVIIWRNKKPIITFSILFFIITLSLVINILFPIGTIMSERFMFMPSLGLSILAGHFIIKGIKHKTWSAYMPWLFGTIILLFSIKTILRNFDWKDNYTLFTHDIKISKNSAKLNNAVGGEIIAQALTEDDETIRNGKIQEAIHHLEHAIKIHPTYKNAYLLLGNARFHTKVYEASIQHYRHALTLDPGYQDAKNNLAVCLREAGKESGEKRGNIKQAITYLLESERLNNKDYETMRLLGVAYGVGQNHENAIKYFTLARNIRPDNADALYNLGSAYYNAGNTKEGENYINQAKAIDPNVGNRNAN
jgi:tetratricopeptide (TPR) repeat protein